MFYHVNLNWSHIGFIFYSLCKYLKNYFSVLCSTLGAFVVCALSTRGTTQRLIGVMSTLTMTARLNTSVFAEVLCLSSKKTKLKKRAVETLDENNLQLPLANASNRPLLENSISASHICLRPSLLVVSHPCYEIVHNVSYGQIITLPLALALGSPVSRADRKTKEFRTCSSIGGRTGSPNWLFADDKWEHQTWETFEPAVPLTALILIVGAVRRVVWKQSTASCVDYCMDWKWWGKKMTITLNVWNQTKLSQLRG